MVHLEVTKRTRRGAPAVEALCEGEVLRLLPASAGVAHVGHWPRLSDPWLKLCPGLQPALKAARRQQKEGGALPSQALQLHGIAALMKVSSLEGLTSLVAADPGYWCDGTAAGDPAPSETQSALLCAGELVAFLQGRRGVTLVQLQLGFDSEATLPLLRPLVLRLLQRAAEAKGILRLGSAAAGGAAVSLVLAAREAPFGQWGTHLADVGVQASLVADSPYYKLLIGRVLGYKPENIAHHIQSHGGKLDAQVIEAVEKQLRALSDAQPQLPWRPAGNGRGAPIIR